MNKMSAKKNKKLIIYSICNNQILKIDFIISSGNYYKKLLIFLYYDFFFIKFFSFKYTTFILLYPYSL